MVRDGWPGTAAGRAIHAHVACSCKSPVAPRSQAPRRSKPGWGNVGALRLRVGGRRREWGGVGETEEGVRGGGGGE